MMISERLWVGTGPGTTTYGPVEHVSTVDQAVEQMAHGVAVVPTTDIAYAVLVRMGASLEWARIATRGRNFERSVLVPFGDGL